MKRIHLLPSWGKISGFFDKVGQRWMNSADKIFLCWMHHSWHSHRGLYFAKSKQITRCSEEIQIQRLPNKLKRISLLFDICRWVIDAVLQFKVTDKKCQTKLRHKRHKHSSRIHVAGMYQIFFSVLTHAGTPTRDPPPPKEVFFCQLEHCVP